jgi:protein-tyrosine phosphatase
MVCMGNICRSPTAHAVLRHKLEAAGLGKAVSVDSAGTHAWHRGKPPDPRAIQHAGRRGYDLSPLRAKGVADLDFADFDLILAMDDDNLQSLKKKTAPEHLAKLAMLSAHAVRMKAVTEVPDPYYGGPNGFDHVLDLVEDACDGLVLHLDRMLKSRIG